MGGWPEGIAAANMAGYNIGGVSIVFLRTRLLILLLDTLRRSDSATGKFGNDASCFGEKKAEEINTFSIGGLGRRTLATPSLE